MPKIIPNTASKLYKYKLSRLILISERERERDFLEHPLKVPYYSNNLFGLHKFHWNFIMAITDAKECLNN